MASGEAKKAFKLTFTDGFRNGLKREESCNKARSPDLTPTHVWRPGRLKLASSATKLLIFHWFSKRFVKRHRKHKNHCVRNIWWPLKGLSMRVVIAIDCRKRFERTHVAFGESGAKKPRNEFAAHTKRLAIKQYSQRITTRTNDMEVVATAGNDLNSHT